MKKRPIYICFVVGLLLPAVFPNLWKTTVSLPMLGLLNCLGGSLPFPLLEYLALTLCAWFISGFVRSCFVSLAIALKKLFRRFACILICALMLFSILWMPLYKAPVQFQPASAEQLAACAEILIRELDESTADFSTLPDDLPAKFARFPFWMRIANLSGFYSFFTGEALISPQQSPSAIPFVAVHESMHGRGVADEGLCNIAAYEECIARGEPYAASARLWALRYILGILHSMGYRAYAETLGCMSAKTWALLQQSGGIYVRGSQSRIQAAFSSLTGSSDYEILAYHLAAKIGE